MKKQINVLMIMAAVLLLSILSCKKEDPVVAPMPEASFNTSTSSCIVPCSVSFTNTSTNANTYRWVFGDGTASVTSTNASHTYQSAGTFTATLTATGEGGVSTATKNITVTAPDYYITFKADNTQVTFEDVFGQRNTSSNPREMIIEGYVNNSPVFTFSTEETFIGFVPGLNISANSSTANSDVLIYSKALTDIYATSWDNNGIDLFVSDVSYTMGGILEGTFSGSLTSQTGATMNVTDGKFRVKFAN